MNTKIVIEASGYNEFFPSIIVEPVFCGKSLLEISIEKLKVLDIPIAIHFEDELPEEEDAQEYHDSHNRTISIAERMGVEIQKSPIAEANSGEKYILYVKCTNPLISIEHYKIALQIPPEKWHGFDSINSSYFINGRLWNDREPIKKESRITALDGSINLISIESFIANGDFVGKNPAFIMIPNNEVANAEDKDGFEIAKMIYEKRFAGDSKERKINIIKKHL